jgi:hypothetical protein
MKMTVIVEDGKVVAAQQGSSADFGRGAGLEAGWGEAGPEAGPGQTIKEIDVPDEIVDVTQPERFERDITQLVESQQ